MALAEVVDHHMWSLLVVVVVPLYLADRICRAIASRIQGESHRQELLESLDQGLCFLDTDGRVTFWNDALERITGCSREHALGRTLVAAVPALTKTTLLRAVLDAATHQKSTTLEQLVLRTSSGERTLRSKILPSTEGVTLLWDDVTERTWAENRLKHSEERFALVAKGANDGLWIWDLKNQEMYLSGRWKAMVGLADDGGSSRPEDWFDRVHPEDVAALRATLEASLSGETSQFQHEHRIRHEDGTYRTFLCRGVAVRVGTRRATGVAGSLTDTTAGIQEKLLRAGLIDPLTKLCNRGGFVDALGQRLQDFKQGKGSGSFATLYLDLDRFKLVNDSLGHMVGDELLTAVSRRLESCLREGDVLARLGGDEFAVLLNELTDAGQANAVAFRIQEALRSPFSIGGREVVTSTSIGIAIGRADYNNPEEIMRDADTAMYHAKAHGKARHEMFDADMHAMSVDRLGLESDLRHAVDRNEFEVQYQPIVSLASGLCVGFESLVRWSRNGVAVSPAKFIPIAEELGIIEQLGAWILQEACRTFADWQRQFPDNKLECITVNVSTRQLMQQHFLLIVKQAVQDARMKSCDLRLEITETTLMHSPGVAAEALRQLREFGVKVYLDDFGTGYSSLSHLHKLPVDALKIDQSFVRSLLLPERPAIVESILALARTLGTGVVAEGIENEEQALELGRLGCLYAQGYFFSRPLSASAAEEILREHQPLGRRPVWSSSEQRDELDVFYPSAFAWPDHAQTPGPARALATVAPDGLCAGQGVPTSVPLGIAARSSHSG